MEINSLLESIPRISHTYRKRLNKLGIKTLRDLFYHFPFRYDDFSNIKPIGDLKLNETATIQGKIIETKNTRTWKKRIYVTEIYVQDDTGIIKAVWFNQPFLINNLKENDLVSISGRINFEKTLYISNPAYEKISQSKSGLRHTGRLVPVYPETSGLTSRYLRYLIQIFSNSINQINDWLPQEIKKSQGLLTLNLALRYIHFPASFKVIEQARHRLAFDELFLIQLFALQQKLRWQKEHSSKINFDESLIKKFVDQLPFKLTDAQRKASWEILQDLNRTRPMNRLLEGDVGSGKTVVATIAALQTMTEGWQVAFMAPTEILANQHWQGIIELLKNYNFKIGLLTASESKVYFKKQVVSYKKSGLLEKISQGEIDILIGTHALIEKKVSFKKLDLVILDEQHRFGVTQRAALQKNVTQIADGLPSSIPHFLSMTATPIPRTLALTIYGDLDISILDEMPKGRQEIITKIVAPANRTKAYEFIRQQAKEGRQIFVICPRIEIANGKSQMTNYDINNADMRSTISDNRNWDEVKAVKEEYEKLSKVIFPDLKIAMLHGKLKPKEKEKIMFDFKASQIDILVSTSVVEVGIDIPNATVMMIEGAERFGLAQLHQFRGRVGRGPHQSYCFLFTQSGSKNTNARLKALVTSNNGFELAEKDLQIRGPGEFLGTQQSGLPDLSMASLSDIVLIKNVRQEAQKLIQKDPELKNYPLLKEKIKKFKSSVHLE